MQQPHCNSRRQETDYHSPAALPMECFSYVTGHTQRQLALLRPPRSGQSRATTRRPTSRASRPQPHWALWELFQKSAICSDKWNHINKATMSPQNMLAIDLKSLKSKVSLGLHEGLLSTYMLYTKST
eukprot:4854040-Amphidinium_carterae.1